MKRTIKEQLRILVKEHESALLPTPDYRRLRRALLERAAAGEWDAPDEPLRTRPREPQINSGESAEDVSSITAPKPVSDPSPPQNRPDPDDPLAAFEDKSGELASPGKSKTGLLVGAGLVALIIAVAGYWWTSNNENSAEIVVADTPSMENDFVQAQRVIKQFTSEEDWTPGRIRHFARDWADLAEQDRQGAKNTGWYREFARDLRDRLNLSELSDSDRPSATTNALKQLAVSLDLRVESRFASAQNIQNETVEPRAAPLQVAVETTEQVEPARTERETVEVLDKSPDKQNGNSASASTGQPVVDVATPANRFEGTTTARAPVSTADDAGEINATSPAAQKTNNIAQAGAVPVGEKPDVAQPVVNQTSAAVAERVTPSDKTTTPAASANQTAPQENNAKQTKANSPASDATVTMIPGTRTARCHPILLDKRRKFCRDTLADGSQAPKLAVIRAGSYKMGSTKRAEEQPVHNVNISKGFALGAYEISFAQYKKFCSDTGSTCPENPWNDDQLPVVNVSWEEATEYTKWLSRQTGAKYRLPSEAEWEYAARAGSQTDYPFGDEISFLQAHFSDSKRREQPVAIDGALIINNKRGLKHVVGNASEWVADLWREDYSNATGDQVPYAGSTSSERVVRGGSYQDRAADLRSSARASESQDGRFSYVGFRVAREF